MASGLLLTRKGGHKGLSGSVAVSVRCIDTNWNNFQLQIHLLTSNFSLLTSPLKVECSPSISLLGNGAGEACHWIDGEMWSIKDFVQYPRL